MKENKLEAKHNGTAGEFQSDSKPELQNTIKKSKVGGSQLDQHNLAKENLRAVMRTFRGCRKNCVECRQEETEWDEEVCHG